MKPLALALLALLTLPALVGCSSSSASSTEGPAPGDGAPPDVTADAGAAADTGQTRDTAAADAPADAPADGAACTLHKPYSTKNAACNACAQERCCLALDACFDDPRCDDDYVNCILACALTPDDAGADAGDALGGCLADCAAKHPAGKAEYDAAIACVDGACAAPCR